MILVVCISSEETNRAVSPVNEVLVSYATEAERVFTKVAYFFNDLVCFYFKKKAFLKTLCWASHNKDFRIIDCNEERILAKLESLNTKLFPLSQILIMYVLVPSFETEFLKRFNFSMTKITAINDNIVHNGAASMRKSFSFEIRDFQPLLGRHIE